MKVTPNLPSLKICAVGKTHSPLTGARVVHRMILIRRYTSEYSMPSSICYHFLQGLVTLEIMHNLMLGSDFYFSDVFIIVCSDVLIHFSWTCSFSWVSCSEVSLDQKLT